MAMREFTDAEGVHWRVWNTIPNAGGVIGPMVSGWLTFESEESRRRLVPIPAGWESATVSELREYCRLAEDVVRTPQKGIEAIRKGGGR
jgi:hypothetical protein